ncbi:glycosyltransferase family 2 protein [Pelagibacteraceae bacterium]|nr:glycosyltransferase family 2 protein [Pelagibacteraceae bacterium]
MSNNISISVVIPTWNRIEKLICCIEAIISQSKDINYEIIICDSNSTDNTEIEINKFIFDRKIKNISLLHSKNNSICEKRNEGIIRAKYNHILLLDDDCILINNAIIKFIELFKMNNKKNIYCGQYITKNNLLDDSNYYRYRDSRNFKLHRSKKFIELNFNRIVTGVCGFDKTEVLKKNILFNENIIGYGLEDADWAWRLIKNDFKILGATPEVLHDETSGDIVNYTIKISHVAFTAMPYLINENIEAAKKIPLYYLEKDSNNKIGLITKIFLNLFLYQIFYTILKIYLKYTDKIRLLYSPFLFRLTLFFAYYQGIQRRKNETFNINDSRKGWFSRGYK